MYNHLAGGVYMIRTSNEIVIYQTKDGTAKLDVRFEKETVWLTQAQMAELFETTPQNITLHIKNAYREGELTEESTCKETLQVQIEGNRKVERKTKFYSLNMIISVGYRVKSLRGTQFRIWANAVLKDYLVKGTAVNKARLRELNKVVNILKNPGNKLDAKQVLSVIERYTVALDLLDDYDHGKIKKSTGKKSTYVLNYEECRVLIEQMRFGAESNLFGNEKDDSFKSSIGAIYQTFDGKEIYGTMEEKAANLLYFVTKNHSFTDGNKRIAAAVFLDFLNKNHALFDPAGKKIIEDDTLVALTIMIAESKPEDKELLINLTMQFIAG
jgi:prophage maintenance system killer protein